MALFDVDIVLSPHEIPSGLDSAEVIERIRTVCRAFVGLGRANVSIGLASDNSHPGITVRDGDELTRLSEGARVRLAALVRAAVRRALFPPLGIAG